MENKNMKRAGAILMIAAVCSCSGLVFAGNTSQANNDGKSFADSINNSKIKDLGKNVDPNTIPNYQGTDVPEKQYYNSGLNIENQAQDHAASDPNAQYINSSRNTRPKVVINSETDPLFKRHEEITSKASSLTDSYSGCVDLPVGNKDVTVFDKKFCHVDGVYYNDYPECHRTYSAQCSNGATYHDPYNKTVDIKLGSKGRNYFTAEVNLSQGTWKTISPSDGDAKVVHFTALNYKTICTDNTTTISYKGASHWTSAPSHVGGGDHDNSVYYRELQRPSCANGLIGKYQIQDTNSGSDTRWVLGGIFSYNFNFVAKCQTKFVERYSCNTGGGYLPSQLHSKTCVYSGYKKVNGFNIYKDCWDWKEIFEIEKIKFVEQPECQQLRNDGCGFVGSDCKNFSSDGHCLDEELTFSCPRLTAARHVSMCGSQLVCPDGQCTSEFGQEYDPSTDAFKKAATALAVADEISKQFDLDNLTVFKGESKACDKKAAGFSNCCKDSGWGADIGLASCSNEEKELGLMKEAKRVHFVGDYCAEKVLGACIRKKYVYCTYPSKLSRILMEQGNAQLGRGYGGAKNPDCKGFTLTELENLNFDAMDLSEFYTDVMSNAMNGSTPNATGAAQSIQEKLNARYPQLSEGGK
ncbi:conjugal transfer protein TraN [Vibrio parahaemolyticus]